ncbi:ryncolin-1-like [Mya arenaria]|uniref:ryncolin-1-like n=1 Tax=Mya arenaria TaxID=6604 RepID=UPI0022E51954|nr:ryncolin-1-like [Mya arenaria]
MLVPPQRMKNISKEHFRNTYEYIMAKLTNNVEKVVSKGVLRMMSAESMILANLSEYMNEAEFRHLKKIEDAEIVTNDAINALNITVKNNKKRETNMLKLIENITSELNEMRTDLHSLLPIGCTTVNGIYSITLENASRNRIPVYCDRVTDGGGWVVFQRRKDGSEDFDRSWLEYKQGFGQPDGEFWLGNELLHQFTSDKPRELRIDMEDFKGKKAHAKYSSFRIYSEKVNYKLEVRGYNGNAGDSLNGVFIGSNGVHNRQSFSTRDNDNDNNESNCATSYLSGWWFKRCYESNLNGKYHSGIHWYSFSSDWSNLKFVEMKFR